MVDHGDLPGFRPGSNCWSRNQNAACFPVEDLTSAASLEFGRRPESKAPEVCRCATKCFTAHAIISTAKVVSASLCKGLFLLVKPRLISQQQVQLLKERASAPACAWDYRWGRGSGFICSCTSGFGNRPPSTSKLVGMESTRWLGASALLPAGTRIAHRLHNHRDASRMIKRCVRLRSLPRLSGSLRSKPPCMVCI